MNVNVDLNEVIEILLNQNKALTLENIILKQALDQATSNIDSTEEHSGEIDI